MLIWTTRFSRKKAVCSVLIMGLIMAALILLAGRQDTVSPEQHLLTDNPQRIAYLQSLGWEVIPEPVETLQFLLPDPLDTAYLAYNELQKTQGFDLLPYCGKQLVRYTYEVTNHPQKADGVQVNLYICENIPIAGDIFCPGTNGFQTSLLYPENTV